MTCPECRISLVRDVELGTPVAVCVRCAGVWFARGRFEELLASTHSETRDSSAVLGRFSAVPSVEPRECPGCAEIALHAGYRAPGAGGASPVVAQRCSECYGIFIGRSELGSAGTSPPKRSGLIRDIVEEAVALVFESMAH